MEGLEMEAVELSPEAQRRVSVTIFTPRINILSGLFRTIEVFSNKLLERIEEYVAEEVVKVDQVMYSIVLAGLKFSLFAKKNHI